MLPEIKVNIDKDFLNFLSEPQQRGMIANLTNKLATRCGQEFRQSARMKFGLKKKPPFKVRRAKPSELIARLWSTIRSFSLMSVGHAVQDRSGITANIGGQPISIPSAFIQSGKGRDWSRRGQKQQKITPETVFKRYGLKPYPLLGSRQLMKQEAEKNTGLIFSLGKYLSSPGMLTLFKQIIDKEAPGMFQDSIDARLKKRAEKALDIDIED